MSRAGVRLSARAEGAARGGHPWIFAGAITAVTGEPAPGDEVEVLGATGGFLGRGLFNPHSQIRVRLYTVRDEPLDAQFFARRVGAALRLRSGVLGLGDPAGACRLVFSEGDDLSGLTVDRYASYLVVQLTGLGIHRHLEPILDHLEEALSPEGILLRTEKGMAEAEGLVLRDGLLRGRLPEAPVEVVEGDLRFVVDLRTGQKTGFYLDQRANRARVAAYAADRDVADVCSYSGGFSVAATRAGATRAVAVDVSASALQIAESNALRNGVAGRLETERASAFDWLAEKASGGRVFDMIVIDPPRFARSRRGVPAALKAYQRLNALAIRCLADGGVLATFSCSGRVAEADFREAVGRAAAGVGRPLRILERLAQAPDHPVSTACPESAYLKGLLCVAG
ncbi:MAG TPA: class I SAM-dependent rRNA methyltransferase [Longimicrobiales bacterium]|nr:class I SAM-dependent rRNA methyltransferase [Longimicrobiales bacterium]